jgi:hypothetical protein
MTCLRMQRCTQFNRARSICSSPSRMFGMSLRKLTHEF